MDKYSDQPVEELICLLGLLCLFLDLFRLFFSVFGFRCLFGLIAHLGVRLVVEGSFDLFTVLVDEVFKIVFTFFSVVGAGVLRLRIDCVVLTKATKQAALAVLVDLAVRLILVGGYIFITHFFILLHAW